MSNFKKILICISAVLIWSYYISAQSIHDYIRHGNIEKVKEFLKKNPECINKIDNSGNTPLHSAVNKELIDVMELLIKKGADLNVKNNEGFTPLNSSIQFNKTNAAEFLVKKGAPVNFDKSIYMNSLYLAVRYNRKKIVDMMIDNQVELPADKNEIRILLHFAVTKNMVRLAETLIEAGADVNSKSRTGGSLLHSAAEGGSADIIEKLISKNMDVNRCDNYHLTPLHIAAIFGRIKTLEILTDNGADLNSKSFLGKTPLQFAKDEENEEAVDFLISRGAEQKEWRFPVLEGKYFGQKKPGKKPELFAPEIVSSIFTEHSSGVFSPDGKAFYWTSNQNQFKIFRMELKNNIWTEPEIASFSGKYSDYNPVLSYDGKRLFFVSGQPLSEESSVDDDNIWYVEKTGSGWSERKPVRNVNSESYEGGPFAAKDGTLYFFSNRTGGKGYFDIYKSDLINDSYTKPEILGGHVNTEYYEAYPCVSPDNDFIIFESDRSKGYGSTDLYISFRNKNGTWKEAVNMGEKINTKYREAFPYFSPDGKYLFFGSDRLGTLDIFWVDGEIIYKLKEK